jgi:hypothetical protein
LDRQGGSIFNRRGQTGLSGEQIEKKGGLPKEVQLLQKPVDMGWLCGFLEALITVLKINGTKVP